MTIGEHLEFSVLTAPVASLDRRGLSQAWYSALYGSASKAQTAATPQKRPASRAGNTAALPHPHAGNTTRAASSAVPFARARRTGNAAGGQIERRAPRSPLARKIERTFLQPRTPAQKASFSIDGSHGRVRVLLQKSGTRMKLVAICAPRAARAVAAALAQARYALATRGIALETETRGDAAC